MIPGTGYLCFRGWGSLTIAFLGKLFAYIYIQHRFK